jgi:hypothetical protein
MLSAVSTPAQGSNVNIVLPSVPVGEGSIAGVYPVNLHISRPTSTPARKFHVQVLQYVKTEIIGIGIVPAAVTTAAATVDLSSYVRIGGVTYELTP